MMTFEEHGPGITERCTPEHPCPKGLNPHMSWADGCWAYRNGTHCGWRGWGDGDGRQRSIVRTIPDSAALPSKKRRITTPIGDSLSGFSGNRLPSGEFIRDSREFLARYAMAHGWIDAQQSNSAWALADEILERYPAITHDQHRMIIDIISVVEQTIGDPNDWDHVGTGLDMLWLIERSI